MLLKTFYKIGSVAMALLVLMSTLSFTMEKHFCGDRLIDFAIFSQANTCGMEAENAVSSTADKTTCCKDEVEIFKGQDKLKKASLEDFHFDQPVFVISLVYFYRNPFIGLTEKNIPHKNYSPPRLVTDIQIINQVFII